MNNLQLEEIITNKWKKCQERCIILVIYGFRVVDTDVNMLNEQFGMELVQEKKY